MKILVDNNRSKLIGSLKTMTKLKKEFTLRHPNAFYIRQKTGWSGIIEYINDNGLFDTGLLPQVVDRLKEMGKKVEILDDRNELEKPKKVKRVADKVFRDYQKKAIKSIVKNKVQDIIFPRGVIKAATNAGKNLIMAGTHNHYSEAKTIILMKEKEWYESTLEELRDIEDSLRGELGWVNAKEEKWGDITVCMVPTLYNRIRKDRETYSSILSDYSIVFADECEFATSKTYKLILSNLINTVVRVGLSGSSLLTLYKKTQYKNQELRRFFGNKLFEISKRDLMDSGHSTELIINILKGNTKFKKKWDYTKEYEKGIIKNKDRNRVIAKQVKKRVKKEKLVQALIISRRHKHLKLLYEIISKELGNKYSIEMVHHKTPRRKEILGAFKRGELDILVASHIVKRAKNYPMIKYICNAGGGDSHEDVLQIMGRGERTHESKDEVIMDDFYDEGPHLRRHSKHRILYYKKERVVVNELYK